MFRFFRALARILFGLILASLAAGLVTVLSIDIDVLSGSLDRLPKTLAETIDLALLAATHIGIFSFVFVLITAAIGEWFSIRNLAFYLVIGITIALLGFSAQYASEVVGQATIFNTYAIRAFLAVGFIGGVVYWLAAGQFAGRPPEPQLALGDAPAAETTISQQQDGEDRSSVVISRPPAMEPAIEERPRWHMPKLERLKFADREAPSEPDDLSTSSDAGDVWPTSRN